MAELSQTNRLSDSNDAISHDETSTAATATATPRIASTDARCPRWRAR